MSYLITKIRIKMIIHDLCFMKNGLCRKFTTIHTIYSPSIIIILLLSVSRIVSSTTNKKLYSTVDTIFNLYNIRVEQPIALLTCKQKHYQLYYIMLCFQVFLLFLFCHVKKIVIIMCNCLIGS